MKILITGATSGIGEATARKLHSEGHEIWVTGRRSDRLEALQNSLGRERIKTSRFDVGNLDEVKAFGAAHAQGLKAVDVLINNAGLAKGTQKIQEGQLSDWQEMIQTNVVGLLAVSQLIIPHMVSRKSGHIVNLGSVAGRWVYPGGAVYCASKFAVRALTEGMRMDLLGTNIRVSNIEPGMVNTEFSLVRLGDQAKADAVYSGMQPLTGSDIADTISWVLARPSHINIQELVIYPTAQAHLGQVHRN